MKNRIIVVIAMILFTCTTINSYGNNSFLNNEICEPCDIDSNVSNGECFCDSIRLYHAYIRTIGDRELAVEAAADYLEECTNSDLGF